MTPEIRLELQVLGIKPVRHKPTRAHATQVTRDNYFILVEWINSNDGHAYHYDPERRSLREHDYAFWLRTLQGVVPVKFSNYLIIDDDNFYPIPEDKYLDKYEDIVQWED